MAKKERSKCDLITALLVVAAGSGEGDVVCTTFTMIVPLVTAAGQAV